MKIAVDIGHNVIFDNGAVSIGRENEMAMDVGERLIERLSASGYQVLKVNPGHAVSLADSLRQRADAANRWGAQLFVSIHMNAGGGTGTEVWIGSERGRSIAEKVVRSIEGQGFRSRGVKVQGIDGKGIFVLRHTTMTAILVEGCFVDSKADMELYDAEKMAFAIWRGIVAGLNDVKGRPLLKRGSRYSGDIRFLQGALGIAADGIFGPETERALREFQKRCGIKSDGMAGQETWSRILWETKVPF